MKKHRKKILWGLLALVAIVAVVALVNLYPMLMMKPDPTGPVGYTGVYAVKNGINSLYFVPSADGYILIDAGSNGDKVAKELEQSGIDPEDVAHILLTHSDYDHVAALALFPNAQIYMSEDELQMLNGTTSRNPGSYSSLPDGAVLDSIVLLEDGQQIELGGYAVTAVKAPGHTPGSMAYWWEFEGFLFTGDAFGAKNGKAVVHPYTMDKNVAQDSIQKLMELAADTRYVFTAHYGCQEANSLSIS